jgi:hypothetical protein
MTPPSATNSSTSDPGDLCADPSCRHRRDQHMSECTTAGIFTDDDAEVRHCTCPAFAEPPADIFGPIPDPTAALTRLQAVNIQPGDLIIGTLPDGCNTTLAAAIGHDLQRRFPDNATMLLPAGVGLHVAHWNHTPNLTALAARGLPTTISDGQALDEAPDEA